MNLILLIVGVLVAVLLGSLLWSAGKGAASRRGMKMDPVSLDLTCRHVLKLPQIRQALDREDLDYVAGKFEARKVRDFRKERRRVALKYLAGLREDFEHLMETAQIVASLSPEVEAKEEWKRFRLAAGFRLKCEIARARFMLGSPAFAGLLNLANTVSGLEMELDRIVGEITRTALKPSEVFSE